MNIPTMTKNQVKSIDRGDVSTQQTRADESISTAPEIIVSSIPQAAIFGAVGGALAVGVIIIVAIILIMVVIARNKTRDESKGKNTEYST